MQNPKETPRSREEVEELVRRLGDPSAGSIMPIREKINGQGFDYRMGGSARRTMVRGTRDLEGRSFDKEAHVSSCPDGNLQIFLQEEQERLQGDDGRTWAISG